MAPIRVGIIGLGATMGDTPIGRWGVNAHLRSIEGLPKDYELVAVANSSVESAQRSIDFHKLPPTTKAYGSPKDIAADPNVDLVVVSVNVAKHYELAKPILEHKKDIFVEWPLASNPAQAEELTNLASASGVRNMVGLQGRSDPITLKLKELLASDKIGKVTSSTVTICTSLLPPGFWLKGAENLLDWKSGGSIFTIVFGHFLDSFTYVLGEFTDVQGLLKSQDTSVPIIDLSNGNVVEPAHPKNVPDHIIVMGTLQNDAVVSMAVRPSKAAADKTGFRWYITGTEGEILVSTDENSWQTGTPSQRSINVISGKGNDTEVIDFASGDNSAASKVASPGTNTARQYASFASKDAEIVTFESALKTHRLLQRIAESAGWDY